MYPAQSGSCSRLAFWRAPPSFSLAAAVTVVARACSFVAGAEAAEGADFIMSCVGNDDDLREVTLGKDGAFSKIRNDSAFTTWRERTRMKTKY